MADWRCHHHVPSVTLLKERQRNLSPWFLWTAVKMRLTEHEFNSGASHQPPSYSGRTFVSEHHVQLSVHTCAGGRCSILSREPRRTAPPDGRVGHGFMFHPISSLSNTLAIHRLVGRLSSHAIFASPSLSSVSRQSSRTACCALLRHPPRGSVSLVVGRGRRSHGRRSPRPAIRPRTPAPPRPTNHPTDRPTDHALVVPIPTASLTKGRSAGRPASPADPLLWHTVGAKRNHDDEGPVCGRP